MVPATRLVFQVKVEGLLLEKSLLAELTDIWKGVCVGFHVIVHGILLLLDDTAIRADVFAPVILKIHHALNCCCCSI